jgi:hypothetical protein
MSYLDGSQALSETNLHRPGPHRNDFHRRDYDHLPLLSAFQPLLADQPRPRNLLPSSGIRTYTLVIIRHERRH